MSIRTRTVTIEQHCTICDVCGIETTNVTYLRCEGCCRDICYKCRIFWGINPFTGDYIGGSISVCHACDQESKSIAQQASQLNCEHDKQIDILVEQWRQKCQVAIQAKAKEQS